jgi:integrase
MKLTNTSVQKMEPEPKRYDVRDDTLSKLILRVEPTGKKTYLVDYTGKSGKRNTKKIGDANVLTVAEAREAARLFLANVALGNEPVRKKSLTVGEILEDHFAEWARHSRKRGDYLLWLIRSSFPSLLPRQVESIEPLEIERLRIEFRKKGLKNATINKKLSALKGMFSWAVRNHLLDRNPLEEIRRVKETDSEQRIRYLTDDERGRLLSALNERDEDIKAAKRRHNVFLAERGLPPVPIHGDHLKPVVLVALNTGIRRGALLALEWRDIDFDTGTISLRAAAAKDSDAEVFPMNAVVRSALLEWQGVTGKGRYVFPNRDGSPMRDCKTAWEKLLKRAEITDFRWHDMRHDFASRLVMAGVDLNTVRELLGHSDLEMTLRYAHLAPSAKKRAVDLLE